MPRNTRYQINTAYYELFLNAIRIINEVERRFIDELQRNRAKFEYWLQRRFAWLLQGVPIATTMMGQPLPGPFQLPGGTPWSEVLRNLPPAGEDAVTLPGRGTFRTIGMGLYQALLPPVGMARINRYAGHRFVGRYYLPGV